MIVVKIIALILLIALGIVLLVVGAAVTGVIVVFGELSIWIFRIVLLVLIVTMLIKWIRDMF